MQRKRLIKPAEYARLRKLNRSTICRQIRAGAIPSENGLVNPAAADRARENNLNQTRREQAARRKQAKRAGQSPEDASDSARLAVVDALRRIAAPSEILRFARVALRAGCSPEQAYTPAAWFPVQVSLALTEVTPEDVEDFREATGAQWRRALGKDLNFDAAGTLYDAATEGEIRGGK